MGRTVPTYRDALTELLARWEREFGRSLTQPADREAFQELVVAARRYIPQGTMMTSGDLVERAVLSLLVELFRELGEKRPPRIGVSTGPLESFADAGP
ncbi:MAG: hypothetical protein L3J93_01970 [Thermoplasmata archaeon]|nr:hypothetical protein [Thermoplasmata archaeon]